MATPTLYPAYYDKANSILIYQDLGTTIDISVGGGGLESYQNSAMSEAVMAYVYRDEEDNIYGVYEPIRNNKVFRSQFAYADSIDKFPFGSADCFNANLNDVKLIDIASDIKIQSSLLETMTINGNNHSGLRFFDYRHKGLYGQNNDGTGEDISIEGDNALFQSSACGAGAYFMNIGDNFQLLDTTIEAEASIRVNGKSSIFLGFGTIGSQAWVECMYDNGGLYDFSIAASADIVLGDTQWRYINFGESAFVGDASANKIFKNLQGVTVGARAEVYPSTNNTITLQRCEFGTGSITDGISSNKTGMIIKNIGGTSYELSVTDGAVTATAL